MSDKSSLSDYLKGLYQYSTLTRAEEKDLWARMQNGDWRAEGELVAHNLRFVVSIAKKMPQWGSSSIPLEDLLQFGNLGLVAAARKWQPQGSTKFASFAKVFIKRYIQRGIENSQNLIRLPVNISEQIRKMLYYERILSQKLGMQPTREQLGIVLGVKPDKIDYLRSVILREPSSLDALTSTTNHLEEDTE